LLPEPTAGRPAAFDPRREILRNAVLAQILAPLGRKARAKRWEASPAGGPKLEHTLVAGVNSAWQFYDLADRVLQAGRQPECIYDLAWSAQHSSTRNRLGGKVNYGQILLLFPLITAQLLDYLASGAFENVDAILGRSRGVLEDSTPSDVAAVERLIHLGYDVSARNRARTGRPASSQRPVLVGRYRTVWEACQDFQSIHVVREITSGFPYSLRIYRFLLHNVESGIPGAIELIHQFMVPELGRSDVVNDLVVAGLYLLLTSHPEGVLFT
jgi:hypothetical protein